MNKSTRERSDGGDAFIPESAQITGTPDDLDEFSGEQAITARRFCVARPTTFARSGPRAGPEIARPQARSRLPYARLCPQRLWTPHTATRL